MLNSLSSAIDDFLAKNPIRFHSPAHAGILNPRDLTEIANLDDLQNPSGVLKQAQEKIAKIFFAQQSWFLLAGASLGMQAALLACKLQFPSSTKKILLARNVHKSTIAGIIISGFDIEWIEPSWDKVLGAFTRLTLPENLENYLAVVITNPSYEGYYSKINKLPLPIIVDEAHGAHYQFLENFPTPALSYGADIVVQSWHKTLGSLTQTGVLHQSMHSKIETRFIDQAIKLLQSTSPNYLLLESLINLNFEFPNFQALINEAKTITSYANDDPSRLLVAMQEELLEAHNIFAEQALNNFTQINLGPGNTLEELNFLKSVIEIDENFKTISKPNFGAQQLNIREAFYSRSKLISKEKSIGCISQELYAPCPPGIALLVPGQIITEDIANRLTKNEVSVIE